MTANKRIFLVAWQLAHVSHIQAASLDELLKPLLFFSQCRDLCSQSLSLAQCTLYLQQTTAPVSERKVGMKTDFRLFACPYITASYSWFQIFGRKNRPQSEDVIYKVWKQLFSCQVCIVSWQGKVLTASTQCRHKSQTFATHTALAHSRLF